ncbi:unnamed protein product [Malus baccata var. baccata]
MGRGRGKAKKQNVIAAREDTGSEEEGILPSRRRGRPQKTLKDDIGEGEVALKTEDGDDAKGHVLSKDMKDQCAIKNGRKRKRSAQVKETIKSVKEDKMIETKSSLDNPKKLLKLMLSANEFSSAAKVNVDTLSQLIAEDTQILHRGKSGEFKG